MGANGVNDHEHEVCLGGHMRVFARTFQNEHNNDNTSLEHDETHFELQKIESDNSVWPAKVSKGCGHSNNFDWGNAIGGIACVDSRIMLLNNDGCHS